MMYNKIKKERELCIDLSYVTIHIPYSRRHGSQVPVYQITTLPLKLYSLCDFSFLPQCLCVEYKCSCHIAKVGLRMGKHEIEIRNVCISDKWNILLFDISQYGNILHNLLRTDIIFSNLIIYPLPPSHAATFQIKRIFIRSYTVGELEKNNSRTAYQMRREAPVINRYNYLKYTKFNCEIKQVNIVKDSVYIEGSIPVDNQEYYLCEIPMFAEFTINEFGRKVMIQPDETRGFSIQISRFNSDYENTYDSLYSRWGILIKTGHTYSLASYAKYAGNIPSEGEIPVITPRSKKGLGAFKINKFESDLDDLHIAYITVNIRINNFLYHEPNAIKEAIEFEYNGKTYYADKQKIMKYDSIMQSAYRRNIIVLAIILVYPENFSRDKVVGRLLEHPDYMTSGAYTMPNMTTLDSLNLYAASIDFLSSRYSRPDGKYGHIHRWIVHNEIDAGSVWTNMGEKDLISYLDTYVKSLRLVYLTTKKHNKNTEVYVPFTHYWKQGNPYDKGCYPVCDMLDILLLYSKREGDFKWGIAHHTYPEELMEPQSWLDANITFDFDTPMITFRNLEVLDAWVKQKHTYYQNNEPRRLILSEQNPNSKDYTKQELDKQAACLAYAWKKMQVCSNIEAYIAHSWIDAHFEGGLKTGLRKYPDDTSDPYGIKPAWNVYKALGTDEEDPVCEFAKEIIGINDWKNIYEQENEKEHGNMEPNSI